MNILMVADNYFPDDIGGSGRVLRELSRGLASRGHHVVVLTRRRDPHHPSFEVCDGVEVYRYALHGMDVPAVLLGTMWKTYFLLNKILDKTSFDIINFHQPLTSLGICLNNKIKGIRKIYTFHSPWHKEYAIKTEGSIDHHHLLKSFFRRLQIGLRKRVEEFVIRQCSHAIVLSRYMKDELTTIHGLDQNRIIVIPGAADMDRFTPVLDKTDVRFLLSLPQDRIVLLTVRNLTPRMGLENLIQALSFVIKIRRDILLVIGGNGRSRAKLEQQVQDLGIGAYVRFVGYIEDQKLSEYYQASDVFILPTRALEGFGLVIVEALACGVPVLATPVGAIEEVLRGCDPSFLFKDSTADSIAVGILRFCGLSREERLNLSEKCRRYAANHFSWGLAAQRTEEAFSQFIRGQI